MLRLAFGSVELSVSSHVVLLQSSTANLSVSIEGTLLPQPEPEVFNEDYKPPPPPASLLFFVSAGMPSGVSYDGLVVTCRVYPEADGPGTATEIRGSGILRARANLSAELRTTNVYVSCVATDRAIHYTGGAQCSLSVAPAGLGLTFAPAPLAVEQGSTTSVEIGLQPPGDWRKEVEVDIVEPTNSQRDISPTAQLLPASASSATFDLSIPPDAEAEAWYLLNAVTARATITLAADDSEFEIASTFLFDVMYDVPGAIGDRWRSIGGPTSPLGKPDAEQETLPDGIGRFQRFDTGAIVWSPQTGAIIIYDSELQFAWKTNRNTLGYPVTDTQVDSSTGAIYNVCQKGLMLRYPNSFRVQILNTLQLKLTEMVFDSYPVPYDPYFYTYTRTVWEDRDGDGEPEQYTVDGAAAGYGPVPGTYEMIVRIAVTAENGDPVGSAEVRVVMATVAPGREGMGPVVTYSTTSVQLSQSYTTQGGASLTVEAFNYATFDRTFTGSDIFKIENVDQERSFELSPVSVNVEAERVAAWAGTIRLRYTIRLVES
jgi:hypothetical protein